MAAKLREQPNKPVCCTGARAAAAAAATRPSSGTPQPRWSRNTRTANRFSMDRRSAVRRQNSRRVTPPTAMAVATAAAETSSGNKYIVVGTRADGGRGRGSQRRALDGRCLPPMSGCRCPARRGHAARMRPHALACHDGCSSEGFSCPTAAAHRSSCVEQRRVPCRWPVPTLARREVLLISPAGGAPVHSLWWQHVRFPPDACD